jgi:hypothetical protein
MFSIIAVPRDWLNTSCVHGGFSGVAASQTGPSRHAVIVFCLHLVRWIQQLLT